MSTANFVIHISKGLFANVYLDKDIFDDRYECFEKFYNSVI